MSFKSISFGDTVKMISGKTPSKQNPDFWNGDVPWISASSMDKLYVSSSSEKITQKALNESGIKHIEAGTPLLLVRGSILHQRIPISIPTKKVTINQDVKALKLKSDILDPDYFIAWLLASERLLLEKVEFTGIGAGKLDTEVLNKLSIPCPKRKHQVFIGRLAKALNQKIELNNQINETLESMAKAIFKDWFIDFGPVRAKAEGKKPFGMDDETAAHFPDSFEESELGQIPKGWRVSHLGETLSVKHGYAFKGEYFSDSPTNDILLTPGNFKIGGGFKEDKLKYYNGPEIDGYLLKQNDLVVTMTDLSKAGDTLGYPALVPEARQLRYFHNQRIGLVTPRQSHFEKLWFYQLLRTDSYRSWILGSCTGSTVKHTSPTRIEEFRFVNPGNELMSLYHNLMISLFEKIATNDSENKTLVNVRDLLLPKLISGEISPKEINL